MSGIDPVLSKMIFQRVLRWTPLMVGAAVFLVGVGLVLSQQLIFGLLLVLVGLALMAFPFLPILKETLELD